MTWTSYAQNFEDVLLRRALSDIAKPCWIDCGAMHPVDCSVTKWASDLGGEGLNIDASPLAIAAFQEARPRDMNLCMGIGSVPAKLTFHRGLGDATGISTFNPAEYAAHLARGFTFESTVVEVQPLSSIIHDYLYRWESDDISFMSIDLESEEHAALAGMDFERWRPRIVLVEAVRPLTQEPSHQSWEPILLNHGYIYAQFDGLNRWYVREEDAWRISKLELPPNIHDDFVPWKYQRRISELEAMVRAREEGIRFLTTMPKSKL